VRVRLSALTFSRLCVDGETLGFGETDASFPPPPSLPPVAVAEEAEAVLASSEGTRYSEEEEAGLVELVVCVVALVGGSVNVVVGIDNGVVDAFSFAVAVVVVCEPAPVDGVGVLVTEDEGCVVAVVVVGVGVRVAEGLAVSLDTARGDFEEDCCCCFLYCGRT